MSLAPGEEMMLSEIENRLRRSDPRLAARLAVFRRRALRGKGPVREFLSPWRARPLWAARLTLLAVLLCVGVVLGLLSSGGL
jgi:hypothetical protein